ncbi:MAG: response regulator transcription factor [Coriobacteriales bacterium]|jgi:DNA-binding response OmpR family regulator|nr:response regulator transcription factor [Coriobacteriales bacterium]
MGEIAQYQMEESLEAIQRQPFRAAKTAGSIQHILLVEAEQEAREALAALLERENFLVTAVEDGKMALDEFSQSAQRISGVQRAYDLVLLSLMLPKLSGEKVCKAIRSSSDVPLIMLSVKGEVEDRIAGLELGADDYLVKPFSPRELVARIRALIRRSRIVEEPQRETLKFDGLTISIPLHRVKIGRREPELTVSEFKLLVTLARFPGRVYTRAELVEKVLGYDFEGYERTIDSHIKNLRAKLGDDSRQPRWLFTVHGVGYRFGSAPRRK